MKGGKLSFLKLYAGLTDILPDHKLASLGDAFINFAYSLALSNHMGKPSAVKVKGTLLAEALRRAGLRRYVPARIDAHGLADAAEALMVYAWLRSYISLEETVPILQEKDDPVEGLSDLLEKVSSRIKFP